MQYFCARLLLVSIVSDQKPKKKNLYDYQFVLVRAANYTKAFKAALIIGKKQETRYEGAKGGMVRWALVRVEEIKKLPRTLHGVEAGSLLDILSSENPMSYRKRFYPERWKPFLS